MSPAYYKVKGLLDINGFYEFVYLSSGWVWVLTKDTGSFLAAHGVSGKCVD